ncbi:MFS transporter [Streptomyces longisporoflavus]|uniref:MFS transporter n=1 Tax=Streptomyces longisporoflavus TaxID=28044 RepID=A0ABW7R022_9ACTN
MVSNEATTGTEPVDGRDAVSRKAEKATWRMTRGERARYQLGYAGYSIGFNIVAYFMTMFLMFQSVNLAVVGSLIFIVKAIDAVDDLLFGYFIDRVNPARLRFLRKIAGSGKYLPWYRVTFSLLPLSTVIFFAMPGGVSVGVKIAWFAVAYLLYDLAATLSQVPMQAMVVTLTDKVTERDSILKFRGLWAVAVAVLSGLVWQSLVSEFVGWSVAGVAIGSAVVVLIMLVPLARKVTEYNVELKSASPETTPAYTVREMFKAVRLNKPMLIILASDMVSGATLTMVTTNVFAAFYLFDNSLILQVPVLFAFVPALILQFFADRIAHAIGKRNAIVGFGLLGSICGITLFFVGHGNLYLVIFLMAIQGVPVSVNLVLRSFLVPDTVEYARYKTGQDCTAIFFAMDSFSTKLVGGVAPAVAMFILGLGGWVTVKADSFADLAAHGVAQPAGALTALWITVSLIPAVGALVCSVVLMFYRLRDEDAALMARCNSGDITREECEAQLSRAY